MSYVIDSNFYSPETSNKKLIPKNTCIISFQNNAIEYIPHKIFNKPDVIDQLPRELQNKENIPIKLFSSKEFSCHLLSASMKCLLNQGEALPIFRCNIRLKKIIQVVHDILTVVAYMCNFKLNTSLQIVTHIVLSVS